MTRKWPRSHRALEALIRGLLVINQRYVRPRIMTSKVRLQKKNADARDCAQEARLVFPEWTFYARSFVSIRFRIRRSSMKQSPEVVQRTQPIMMITFMSIGAGSCPAGSYFKPTSSARGTLPKDTAKGLPSLLPF